jgi:dihydropyrimidinase
MTVQGSASHTLSQGKMVWADGELDVERGAGRYVDRPPFASYYDALTKHRERHAPSAVRR